EEPNADWDGDGLTNLQEAYIGSDPQNADTDGDGLSDLEEFDTGSSVFSADTDGDGLDDKAEGTAGTNPTDPDTDGDGFSDKVEVDGGTDPLDRWSWAFGGEGWPDMSAFGETTYPSGWYQGDVLPTASLIDQFGAALEMAQFHGYVVLFDFSAGWCMPCRETAETAQALWETYRDQGFMIVHLLIEGNQAGMAATLGLQNEWKTQYGLSFPVTREPEGGEVYKTLSQKSDIYPGSLPFLVLLDRDMRIDSGYGAGQDAVIEARIQALLQTEVSGPTAATAHGIGQDPAAICDADGDGHRHGTCGGGDCADADAAIHPAAPELCDLSDHDCDGWLHQGASDAMSRYADEDHDGYGDPEVSILSCGTPWPYVDNADDCDDLLDSVHPNQDDLCNGVDEDCDALTPDGSGETWFDTPCDGIDSDQ
ncbi:MAG: MopE-related protein, partial [Myxococcota bacterium]|nr:MopE-related protein [Myxococcota bacterium]